MNSRRRNAELRNALHKEYEARKDEIRSRLDEFRRVPPERYFYELLYCLLTPQSSAANAAHVQQRLEELRFYDREFDPEKYLASKDSYIRFHRTKSRMLVSMKHQFPAIKEVLSADAPASEIRDRLVGLVKGIGYKESTHFLRNIGRNDGLAILDRHILRNLIKYGAVRELPKSLTRKRYLALEEKFQQFAEEVGIPIDELDLLFWSLETGMVLK